MARAIRMNKLARCCIGGSSAQHGVLLLVSLMGLLTLSCSSHRFTMQDQYAYPVRAVILTHPTSVNRTHDNGFEMRGPARVAMRAERITHGMFTTEITRTSTSPLIIQLRTTPYEDSVLHRRGMLISIIGDSTTIETSDNRSVFFTPLPIGRPFLVDVRSVGWSTHVRIGHTDCGVIRSQLPCTEWVILSLKDSTSVMVGDPWFDVSI